MLVCLWLFSGLFLLLSLYLNECCWHLNRDLKGPLQKWIYTTGRIFLHTHPPSHIRLKGQQLSRNGIIICGWHGAGWIWHPVMGLLGMREGKTVDGRVSLVEKKLHGRRLLRFRLLRKVFSRCRKSQHYLRYQIWFEFSVFLRFQNSCSSNVSLFLTPSWYRKNCLFLPMGWCFYV